jgi:NAD(P)-dependent dehydrogenase (short-subunit alcohol dehydrogenase family)
MIKSYGIPEQTMPNLEGRIWIVTGSTGIAAATARMAAAAGARLILATADAESGWGLAAEIGAECWVGDLSRPASADSVVSQCLSKFARVDALFNAAGLSGRRFGDGPVDECTDEGWGVTLAQNLTTAFFLCRAVVNRMLQQAPASDGMRGAILNIGSVLSDSPEPRHFATHAYAAAKGGVVALSRSMAAYYAPHKIRVNVIAPALVRTPSSERSEADPELTKFVKAKQPLVEGLIDAQEVARAALFLLSDEARTISGDLLRIDAGWSVTGT